MRKCLRKYFISEMVSTMGGQFGSADRFLITSDESELFWCKIFLENTLVFL